MAKFCENCGTKLEDQAKFCPNCGAQQQAAAAPGVRNTAQYAAPATGGPAYAGGGAVRSGIPAPGFSDRVNDPRILAAVRKNRRAAGVFAFFLVPLPLIGFTVYGMVGDQMEPGQAAGIGGVISAVFLVFALYGFIKERAKNTYEATVIDKESRLQHSDSDDGNGATVREYVTTVRTANGKKKRIVERQGPQIWAWTYLNVGDRFRYHPQFHFPYELYDKSRAPYIACVSCAAQNPVEADCCRKCGLPLLK